MQSVMKLVCFAYAALLTVLLLAADPAKTLGVLGIQGMHGSLPEFLRALTPFAHGVSFFLADRSVALLTMLLLLSFDSAKMHGIRGRLPEFLRTLMPFAHGISFCLLTALALLPRWPIARWAIVFAVVLYSGATELAQGVFPPRTPEWKDWFQNLIGITIGSVFCWAMSAAYARWAVWRSRPAACVSCDSRGLIFQAKEFSESGAGSGSWWN